MHSAIPRPELGELGELDRELAGLLRFRAERLGMRRGYGRDWITGSEALSPDNAGCLGAKHAAVQRFTVAVIEADPAAGRPGGIVQLLGHRQATAVLMPASRSTAHARMADPPALPRLCPPSSKTDSEAENPRRQQ